MKTKEYIPNTLFNNVLAAIRKELQKAITEAMVEISKTCDLGFQVEGNTLWTVMRESAYLTVIVKKDGEFTYLRRERVIGAVLPPDPKERVSLYTDSSYFYLDELGADDLSSVYAFVDGVRQRLASGEFVSDCSVVIAVDAETNRLPAAAHAA